MYHRNLFAMTYGTYPVQPDILLRMSSIFPTITSKIIFAVNCCVFPFSHQSNIFFAVSESIFLDFEEYKLRYTLNTRKREKRGE